MFFDGINDYIQFENSFFNQNNSVEALTYSIWVKLSEYPTTGSFTIAEKDSYWRRTTLGVSSQGLIYFNGTVPFSYWGIESLSQIPIDSWTHIAVSFESGVLKLYLNGVLDNQVTTDITFS